MPFKLKSNTIVRPNAALPTENISSSLTISDQLIEFTATQVTSQNIMMSKGLLEAANPTLASVLNGPAALIVITKTIEKLYGPQLHHYLNTHLGETKHRVMTIETGESNKDFRNVLKICEAAADMKLRRRSTIVGIGGGICTDICGLAAAVYNRGVAHIKVPTTLLGIVDAGIGTKNGVNLCGHKNKIGTFRQPEWSLLDTNFIATLDTRHIRCGVAEILKMAIISDLELFELLEKDGVALIDNHFSKPEVASAEVVKHAVVGMLEHLSRDLYEVTSYKRMVDFGHTFSPYIEIASDHEIHHGEAVAIDMALSTVLARDLGLVPSSEAERILRLSKALGLPLYSDVMQPEPLWDSLANIVAHRNGNLNLVVPTKAGECTFVEKLGDITLEMLVKALEELESA